MIRVPFVPPLVRDVVPLEVPLEVPVSASRTAVVDAFREAP